MLKYHLSYQLHSLQQASRNLSWPGAFLDRSRSAGEHPVQGFRLDTGQVPIQNPESDDQKWHRPDQWNTEQHGRDCHNQKCSDIESQNHKPAMTNNFAWLLFRKSSLSYKAGKAFGKIYCNITTSTLEKKKRYNIFVSSLISLQPKPFNSIKGTIQITHYKMIF